MEKTLIFSSASEVRFRAVLRFIVPTYLTSLFNTLYTIVDGIFISRFLGSNALSSLNIVYPVINVEIAISTMLGTGGNAIISKYLGEEKNERAREALTQFVVLALLLSVVLLLFCAGVNFSAVFDGADVSDSGEGSGCKTYHRLLSGSAGNGSYQCQDAGSDGSGWRG